MNKKPLALFGLRWNPFRRCLRPHLATYRDERLPHRPSYFVPRLPSIIERLLIAAANPPPSLASDRAARRLPRWTGMRARVRPECAPALPECAPALRRNRRPDATGIHMHDEREIRRLA